MGKKITLEMIKNKMNEEKNMKKRNILILSAALLLMVGSALAQDVSGEWEMTTAGGGRGGRGEGLTQTITFEQDGEKITVTMEGRMGEMTGEGTIKDNKIEWTFTMETPRGDMQMAYTGTVDGDSMSGQRKVGMGDQGRESEWTAKKK